MPPALPGSACHATPQTFDFQVSLLDSDWEAEARRAEEQPRGSAGPPTTTSTSVHAAAAMPPSAHLASLLMMRSSEGAAASALSASSELPVGDDPAHRPSYGGAGAALATVSARSLAERLSQLVGPLLPPSPPFGGPASISGAAAVSPLDAAALQQDSFDLGVGVHLDLALVRPMQFADTMCVLGATPGKYVVQIISEFCDEGTLHAAIKKNVFRHTAQRSRTWALRALLRTAREVRALAGGRAGAYTTTAHYNKWAVEGEWGRGVNGPGVCHLGLQGQQMHAQAVLASPLVSPP